MIYPMKHKTVVSHGTCSIYLETCYRLLSICRCIPYRVEWDHVYKAFVVRRLGRISQVLCYSIQLGFLVEQACSYHLLFKIYRTDGNVLAVIFSTLSYLGDLGVWLTIRRVLWLKRDLTLNLLTLLTKLKLSNKSKWRNGRIYQAIFLIIFVCCIKTVGGILSLSQFLTWQKLTDMIVSAIETTLGGKLSSEFGNTFLQNIVSVFVFLFMRQGAVYDAYLMATAFTANMVATQFVENLTETRSTDSLIGLLHELKDFNEKVNLLLGNTFAFHFISTIANYAGIPAYMRKSDGVPWKLCYKGIYAIAHAMLWVWTCEFHRKVQVALRKWIYKRKGNKILRHVEAPVLNLLAMEVENDPVGISCLCFTVNHDPGVSVCCIQFK